MKRCKTLLIIALALNIALTGCAYKTATPVLVSQIGDEKRSCNLLYQEMQQMQMLIKTSDEDGNRQVVKNVLLGVTGIFLIVPWFFMDVGNAASVEGRAAQARLQKLQIIAASKECTPPGQYDYLPASSSASSPSSVPKPKSGTAVSK